MSALAAAIVHGVGKFASRFGVNRAQRLPGRDDVARPHVQFDTRSLRFGGPC